MLRLWISGILCRCNLLSTKQKIIPNVSNWKYWNIYLRYGLKGSAWNIFYINPVIILLVMLEVTANGASTYAMTFITKTIMNLSGLGINPRDTINDINHISSNNKFIFLLAMVLFTNDFTKFMKRIFYNWSTFYKDKIVFRIIQTVVNHIKLASPETKKEHGIDSQYEALNQFSWVYDNVTDTLVDTIVQTARFLTFCSYIIYEDPRLLFVLCVIYVILWYYIVKRNINKKNDDGDKFWSKTYYDIATEESICVNPLFEQLYHTGLTENVNSSIKGKITRPDVSERYMETLRYYSIKHRDWINSHDTIQIIQNVVSFMIIMFLFSSKRYGTALVVLINRSTMFGVLASFTDMIRCEKNAERNMEKIVKILNAIDTQLEKSSNKLIQVVDPESDFSTRLQVEIVFIDKMIITIPCTKTDKKIDVMDDLTDLDNKLKSHQHIHQYDRYISLESAEIHVIPRMCILLDGHTGCGKSVTINAFAGLYSDNICNNMNVKFKSGKTLATEFNQLRGSRCYISQMLSDDYKYNGKIDLPLYKLFPGAKDIQQVSNFLKEVFTFRDNCIPQSLEDSPHSKLSGGEIQRYIVASQIWKALQLRPDIIIMDEIDRALDKETAVHVLSWIIDNVNSFFIIVSHLTEVKQMLFDKQCVEQVWTYDEEDDNHNINIRIKIINK
jgi:ABC-type multidrug transport system ATPase subunit